MRESERACVSGERSRWRGRERTCKQIPLSMEAHVQLDSRTQRSWTELKRKVSSLTKWSSQATHFLFLFFIKHFTFLRFDISLPSFLPLSGHYYSFLNYLYFPLTGLPALSHTFSPVHSLHSSQNNFSNLKIRPPHSST